MFRTYIYQDDDAARELGKLVEKHKLDWVPLRSPDEIDCGDACMRAISNKNTFRDCQIH